VRSQDSIPACEEATVNKVRISRDADVSFNEQAGQ
jgi:hypothetical protein